MTKPLRRCLRLDQLQEFYKNWVGIHGILRVCSGDCKQCFRRSDELFGTRWERLGIPRCKQGVAGSNPAGGSTTRSYLRERFDGNASHRFCRNSSFTHPLWFSGGLLTVTFRCFSLARTRQGQHGYPALPCTPRRSASWSWKSFECPVW
jgi:hypothetical protein